MIGGYYQNEDRNRVLAEAICVLDMEGEHALAQQVREIHAQNEEYNIHFFSSIQNLWLEARRDKLSAEELCAKLIKLNDIPQQFIDRKLDSQGEQE